MSNTKPKLFKNDSDCSKKSISDRSSEECHREERMTVVPPDGGWGWIVAVAAFMCNMTADGNLYCFGVFLPHIAKSFDVAQSEISVISSLIQGIFLMVGPLTGIVVDMYGLRLTAIAGGLLATAGYVSSYFVYSIPLLYFTHGILVGVGFGFIFMTSMIAVGFYFEKWRALATGIAVCGSGVGTIVFSPLYNSLIHKFGWRNVLLFEACTTSLAVAYGLCFRPLKPKQLIENEKSDIDSESQPLKHNTEDTKLSSDLEYEGSLKQRELSTRRMTVADVSSNNPKEHPVIFYSKEDLLDERMVALDKEREGSSTSGINISRPLSRKDIFYSGNLAKIPDYSSVLSVYTARKCSVCESEKAVEDGCFCKICGEKRPQMSLIMLHVGILKSPSFILYCFHGLFVMLGFLTPFLFSGQRAKNGGLAENLAVWLVSSIGIANTCGKIMVGLLISLTGVEALLVYAIGLLLGGISLICSGFSMSPGYQLTSSVIFGLSIACSSSLKPIVLVELLGLDKLTNAFGLLLFFLGIGSLVGPPFITALMEFTGNHDIPFYVAGGCFLISSSILFSLKLVNKWEKNRTSSRQSDFS